MEYGGNKRVSEELNEADKNISFLDKKISEITKIA